MSISAFLLSAIVFILGFAIGCRVGWRVTIKLAAKAVVQGKLDEVVVEAQKVRARGKHSQA